MKTTFKYLRAKKKPDPNITSTWKRSCSLIIATNQPVILLSFYTDILTS